MANEEHVALLKRGVDAWNAWRCGTPDVLPDLRQAYLSGANLSKAFLLWADLRNADLIGADLSNAYLINAPWARQA